MLPCMADFEFAMFGLQDIGGKLTTICRVFIIVLCDPTLHSEYVYNDFYRNWMQGSSLFNILMRLLSNGVCHGWVISPFANNKYCHFRSNMGHISVVVFRIQCVMLWQSQKLFNLHWPCCHVWLTLNFLCWAYWHTKFSTAFSFLVQNESNWCRRLQNAMPNAVVSKKLV